VQGVLASDFDGDVKRYVEGNRAPESCDEAVKREMKAVEARAARAAEPAKLLNALIWSYSFGPIGYFPEELRRDYGHDTEYPKNIHVINNFPLLPSTLADGTEIMPALRFEGEVSIDYVYGRRFKPTRVSRAQVAHAYLLLTVPDFAEGKTPEAAIAEYTGSGHIRAYSKTIHGFNLAQHVRASARGSVWDNAAPIDTDSQEHEMLTSILTEALAVETLRKQDGETT
jgi:hypothetical protein